MQHSWIVSCNVRTPFLTLSVYEQGIGMTIRYIKKSTLNALCRAVPFIAVSGSFVVIRWTFCNFLLLPAQQRQKCGFNWNIFTFGAGVLLSSTWGSHIIARKFPAFLRCSGVCCGGKSAFSSQSHFRSQYRRQNSDVDSGCCFSSFLGDDYST